MTEYEIDSWHHLTRALANDDGAAAQQHLDAGNPVYHRTPTTPKDVIEKLFPDGRRQLVTWDRNGEHVVADLP